MSKVRFNLPGHSSVWHDSTRTSLCLQEGVSANSSLESLEVRSFVRVPPPQEAVHSDVDHADHWQSTEIEVKFV